MTVVVRCGRVVFILLSWVHGGTGCGLCMLLAGLHLCN